MAKNKKSKILAMALCASVMTGIYASPVMAAELEVVLDGKGIVANEVVGVTTEQHDVTGTLTIAGSDIATALNGTNLTLGSVTANTISTTGNTEVGGTLTAAGAASLNGGLTVTGDTVIDGGRLFANKGLTVSSDGILIKEGGSLSLADGNVDVGGNLTVNGETTLKNTKVNGTLDVTGDTTLAGLKAGATDVESLDVTNNATVGGTLEVTGETTLAGLTAGATDVDSLGVTNNATVGGTLEVTGETTLAGLTAGATTVDSLTVKGAAKVNSLEVANGIKAANGTFQLTDAGVLTVGGKATFTDKVTVMNGLSVAGGASVDGNFAVTNGGLSVSGGESVLNGGLTVNNGDTKLNGKLDVGAGNFKVDTAGNTEFNGNLNIGHDAFEVTAADGSFSAARDKFNVFADGSFNAASENFKVSADGVINADSLYLQTYGGGTLEVGEALQALTDAKLPDKVGGIERDPAGAGDPGDGTTTIENGAEFTETAMTMGDTIVESGKITVGAEDAQTIIEGGAITTNTINAGGTIINNAGMTVGDTVVADSKITVGAADDQTIIDGGAITAESLTLGSLDGREVGAVVNALEQKTGGIERVESAVAGADYTTIIEYGALKISDNGYITNKDGTFAIRSDGSFEMTELNVNNSQFVVNSTGVHMNLGMDGDRALDYKGEFGINLGKVIDDIDTRLDVLEDKTQNIKPGAGTGTGTGTGGTAAGEINNILPVVPDTEDGHTGINGNVTVGGEINAGEIVVGDKTGGNQTTITDDSITTDKGDFGSEVTVGDNTTITSGNITVGAAGDQTTINGGTINTGDINAATGDFSESVTVGVEGNQTTINGGTINTDNIIADKGNIGKVDMTDGVITVNRGTTIDKNSINTEDGQFDNSVTVGNVEGNQTTINGGNVAVDKEVTVGANTTITDGNINLGGEDGTNINADGMIVGNANGVNTNVSAGDVVITDKDGKDIALSDVGYVEDIDSELKGNEKYDDTVVGGINAEADIRRAEVNRLDNRISKVEDRVDKVGAMSAAIANLRTMGYDPAAPTEIAVGVGQYRSETGVALGMFHYPNKDFMLSLSVSTSGDEVMGGIGATWKFGRKSPEKVLAAEKEKAAKAKLAKAEAMKKAAKEAKIKAQQERHAKLAAERAAQAEAAK